jgi:hypothetical protein
MVKTKKVLKLALIIELLVGIFLLFFYKPSGCTIDCLHGLNAFVVYLLPLVGLTVFSYIAVKIYEGRAKKQSLRSDQKFIQFFVSFIVLLIIIYGLYYWFNR